MTRSSDPFAGVILFRYAVANSHFVTAGKHPDSPYRVLIQNVVTGLSASGYWYWEHARLLVDECEHIAIPLKEVAHD